MPHANETVEKVQIGNFAPFDPKFITVPIGFFLFSKNGETRKNALKYFTKPVFSAMIDHMKPEEYVSLS